MKQVVKRIKGETPPFFKRLRNIGLVLAGIAGAVLTAPITLPAVVTTIAGYVAVGGSVLTTVSQLTSPSTEE